MTMVTDAGEASLAVGHKGYVAFLAQGWVGAVRVGVGATLQVQGPAII